MLKFSFRREREKEFKHIAHGLIPAASIAPKPAVPRTPPPRSPNPSPERPRSALAAAILSSSLTGQTWAIPPVRPRSFSELDQSESFISEPNVSAALFARDRWSEDLESQQHLSSPEHSEGELEDREEEEENEEDEEEHVYQTLDGLKNSTFKDLPLECEVHEPVPTQMSGRGVSSPDFTEESSDQSPEATGKRASIRKNIRSLTEDVPSMKPIPANINPSCAKKPPKQKTLTRSSPDPSGMYSEVRRERKTRAIDKHKILEERLQRLEQEISNSQASSDPRPPERNAKEMGGLAELQSLRRQAQELVDENDALKLTVHRLNVELSRYQARFRPLSKQESSKINGLPTTGSPPPWLLDMKYLCPLLLAYEDRMNEKDELMQTTEEGAKKARARLKEVIKENETLREEISRMGVVSQKDCEQLQQQALLVLQENQSLIDQLEAQRAKSKANHSRQQSEVTKVSKQLMLLEAEKQHLQEELEESRREVQRHVKEVQLLRARLKDAVTWDEHCSIAGELRGHLEKQESRSKSEIDELLLRVSALQEENRSLVLDRANLTADVNTAKAELELCRQANRKAERKISMLKKQREDCTLKEEKTRHYLGAVISVAENISKERDQLIHMLSNLPSSLSDSLGHSSSAGKARICEQDSERHSSIRQATRRCQSVPDAGVNQAGSARGGSGGEDGFPPEGDPSPAEAAERKTGG
ncbi:centrosomal protein of 89 kDa isoform 2-T2 [Menidia menidia]